MSQDVATMLHVECVIRFKEARGKYHDTLCKVRCTINSRSRYHEAVENQKKACKLLSLTGSQITQLARERVHA